MSDVELEHGAALPLEPGPARVLVVEDEPKLAALLADYLRAAGHEPECVADGREVLPAWTARRHDLILLDLMLPGIDGLALCRELRARSAVPILMLTARADEADRLLGLELGADDYIAKNPFSPREVMARVKAVLRRSRATAAAASGGGGVAAAAGAMEAMGAMGTNGAAGSAGGVGVSSLGSAAVDGAAGMGAATTDTGSLPVPVPSPISSVGASVTAAAAAGLTLDPDGWRAFWAGQALDLTPIEFRLLHILASQPGRAYSRMQLLELLHVDGREVTERAIDSHVKNLRRKLEKAGGDGESIRAIYGVGYRYDG